MDVRQLEDYGLVTTAEACARMGWAPKTVQNWVKSGLLPVVVIGKVSRGSVYLIPIDALAGLVRPRRGRRMGTQNRPATGPEPDTPG